MIPRRDLAVAVTASGLSSLGNFVLTVAVARRLDAFGFGYFAIAMILASLVVGVLRAAILEHVVTTIRELSRMRSAIPEVFVIGVFMAGVGVAGGFLTSQTMVMVIFAGLPGLVVFDFLRNICIVGGRAEAGLWMEVAWTTTTIAASGLCIVRAIEPLVAVAVWAGVPTLASIAVVATLPPVKNGDVDLPRRWFRAIYAADYLVGSGSGHVSTAALGGVGQPGLVGALRAAGTLFSPINLVTSALRPQLLTRLSDGSGEDTRRAAILALQLGTLLTPLALLVLFMPDRVGRELLGASWAGASDIRLPLALEALLGLAAGIPQAGQRSLDAGAAILRTRSALAFLRLVAIVVAATVWGLAGAAWSIPSVTAVGLVVWWRAYARGLAARRQEAVRSHASFSGGGPNDDLLEGLEEQ